jgi:hypothetical protein
MNREYASVPGEGLGTLPGRGEGNASANSMNNAGDVPHVSDPAAASTTFGSGPAVESLADTKAVPGKLQTLLPQLSANGTGLREPSMPGGTLDSAPISSMGSAPDPPVYVPAGAALLASLDGTGQMSTSATAPLAVSRSASLRQNAGLNSLPVSRSASLHQNAGSSPGLQSPAPTMPGALDTEHLQRPLMDGLSGTSEVSTANGLTGNEALGGQAPTNPYEGSNQGPDLPVYDLAGNRQEGGLTDGQDISAGAYAVSSSAGNREGGGLMGGQDISAGAYPVSRPSGIRQEGGLSNGQDISPGAYISSPSDTGPRISDLHPGGPPGHQGQDYPGSLLRGSQPSEQLLPPLPQPLDALQFVPASQPLARPSTVPEQPDHSAYSPGIQAFDGHQNVPRPENFLQHSPGSNPGRWGPEPDLNHGALSGLGPTPFDLIQGKEASDSLPNYQESWKATQDPCHWDEAGVTSTAQYTPKLGNGSRGQDQWAGSHRMTFGGQQDTASNGQYTGSRALGLAQSTWNPDWGPDLRQRPPFDMRPQLENHQQDQVMRNSTTGEGRWTAPSNRNYGMEPLGAASPASANQQSHQEGNNRNPQNTWAADGDIYNGRQQPAGPLPYSLGEYNSSPGNKGLDQGSGAHGWGPRYGVQPGGPTPPPGHGFNTRRPETTEGFGGGQGTALQISQERRDTGYNALEGRADAQNGGYYASGPRFWPQSDAWGGPPNADAPWGNQRGEESVRDENWSRGQPDGSRVPVADHGMWHASRAYPPYLARPGENPWGEMLGPRHDGTGPDRPSAGPHYAQHSVPFDSRHRWRGPDGPSAGPHCAEHGVHFGPRHDVRGSDGPPAGPHPTQYGGPSGRHDGGRGVGRHTAQTGHGGNEDDRVTGHPSGMESVYPHARASYTSQW